MTEEERTRAYKDDGLLDAIRGLFVTFEEMGPEIIDQPGSTLTFRELTEKMKEKSEEVDKRSAALKAYMASLDLELARRMESAMYAGRKLMEFRPKSRRGKRAQTISRAEFNYIYGLEEPEDEYYYSGLTGKKQDLVVQWLSEYALAFHGVKLAPPLYMKK